MEACRERALRRHEETLRKRRGCRALYRQRLRAEFSCMISDLARLDKHTRLAKLESEAKAVSCLDFVPSFNTNFEII